MGLIDRFNEDFDVYGYNTYYPKKKEIQVGVDGVVRISGEVVDRSRYVKIPFRRAVLEEYVGLMNPGYCMFLGRNGAAVGEYVYLPSEDASFAVKKLSRSIKEYRANKLKICSTEDLGLNIDFSSEEAFKDSLANFLDALEFLGFECQSEYIKLLRKQLTRISDTYCTVPESVASCREEICKKCSSFDKQERLCIYCTCKGYGYYIKAAGKCPADKWPEFDLRNFLFNLCNL